VTRDASAIPLLADLLSIPLAESCSRPALTPAQRKEATLALLADEILRLSESAPVLLVMEDAHWIDASTMEWMTRLVDCIGVARVLAMVTARPDFAPPWQTRPHATLLTLGRLGRADCRALAAAVERAQHLSSATIDAIVAKTDGVPLFVEEMTKTVAESPDRDRVSVPLTLNGLLMARLERLGEAREIAQIASVIGRQFAFALLAAVAPREGGELDAALARLVAAGIVLPVGRGLERGYAFKHELVRDAAYESLLLSRRRILHERIARSLEERFPEIASSEPELLARHFGYAGLAGPAADYRDRAGDLAVGRSAYQEAVTHYTAGIEETKALPQDEGQRRRLAFLLKLGPALAITKGVQSTETESIYREASEAAETVGDAASSYKAKWGLWHNANLGRKTAVARDRADELVVMADRMGDDDLLLEAYHCRWSTAFFRGDVAPARHHGQIGVARYEPARHCRLAAAFGGHDPGVCAHLILGLSESLSSDQDEARRQTGKGIALAESLGHPHSQVHALLNAAIACQIAGDRDGAEALAAPAIALTEKFGFPPYRLGSLLLLAWARGSLRPHVQSAEMVGREIDRAVAVGPNSQHYLGLAGEVMLVAGRHAEAMALLDRALAANEEPEVGCYLPEIHRLRGVCLLAMDRSDGESARRAFATALAIANRQGAVVFARRAGVSLADVA